MTASDKNCKNPATHPKHLCQLKKMGLHEDVKQRRVAPAYVCHNCNAQADHAEDLCNPGALPGPR
jgi:hypothetical protein